MSVLVFRVILLKVINLNLESCVMPMELVPRGVPMLQDFELALSRQEALRANLVDVIPKTAADGSNYVILAMIVLVLVFLYDVLNAIEDQDEKAEFSKDGQHSINVHSFGNHKEQVAQIEDKLDDTWNFKSDEVSISSNVEDGVNGVYFVKKHEDDKIFGIFKPAAEEAFGPANQKERTGVLGEESPLKSGVYVGDAYKKEVAAYLLDHQHFANVPETKFTSLGSTPAIGSLQRFVNNKGSSEDFASSKFSVRDVHAIGLLDARLANLDRHSGNMLAVDGEGDMSLVPIDHGFSLPDYNKLKDVTFDWVSWKQASIPFSEETKQYLESIDVVADARTLKRLGLRDESIITYMMCSTVTKIAVRSGWTLKMIGEFMQRDLINDQLPSGLENLIQKFITESNFTGLDFADYDELKKFLDTFMQFCEINVRA